MTRQLSEEALLIFVKNPVRGQVKTRLAQGLDADRALDIYRLLLKRTRRIALALPVRRIVYYTPRIDPHDDWRPPAFGKKRQQGADLGARMHHALREALTEHKAAILIGSDIANLSQEILAEAFQALRACDCVIGPARDGGYYLIGMKKAEEQLFSDIPWSTAEVYGETIKRMERLGLDYRILPTLADIDTADDWLEFKHDLEKED